MKNKYIFILAIIIVVVSLWGIPQVISMSNNPDRYSSFCDSEMTAKWNLVIYLNVDACIACTEDIASWKKLEETLPEYNGRLTLWAPKSDSFDVAYAMELEGLKTPVNVIDKSTLRALGWDNKETPIKVLLDNNCQSKKFIGAMNNAKQSRIVIDELLAEVASKDGQS